MPSRFRIHPAIGVARVGNAAVSSDGSSGDGFFLGPETPGLPPNWDLKDRKFLSFKSEGKIKRQAVRFRIWEYSEEARNGTMVPREEVTLDDKRIISIRWTVDVANTKASFYIFDEARGVDDRFGKGQERRNPDVPAEERREKLEIRPGPKSIQGRQVDPIDLLNPNEKIPITTLGQLRTDKEGRLIFLGGLGQAASSRRLPPPPSCRHPVRIHDSYNNTTWFDDVSDGPVKATIRLREDGEEREIEADGAWVIVGPPDFAPAIPSVVTLYDVLVDLAVRELTIPSENGLFTQYQTGRGLGRLVELQQQLDQHLQQQLPLPPPYRPSYQREILPVLTRASLVPWVHDSGYSFHEWLAPSHWKSLGDPAGREEIRKAVFDWLRDPNDTRIRPWHMPRIFADNYGVQPRRPSRYLALPPTLYALMGRWAERDFVGDYTGPITIPARTDISPEGLDRAALEGCSGGGFCPGMEVGWLITRPEIYSEPFRVKAGAAFGSLTVEPGFFTQQIALPWHADFFECSKEEDSEAAGLFQAWWPANRPDDVRRTVDEPRIEWARGMRSHEDMVRDWSGRGLVLSSGDAYLEEDGPPA